MYERRFWVIEVNAISPTHIYNNFKEEDVDKLWAEAVHMYKENPDMELYLGEEYVNEAKNDQTKFKSFNVDDDISFIKDSIFEREYIFPINNPTYKGSYYFTSYEQFANQVNNVANNTVADGINFVSSKVNIIEASWIKKYLIDTYHVNKSHKYISFATGWSLKQVNIYRIGNSRYYVRNE
jgi:hypothetical protein